MYKISRIHYNKIQKMYAFHIHVVSLPLPKKYMISRIMFIY
jgi:hypothetical protein